MAKKKQKKTKKIIYWLFMLVLLIAAAGVTYLVWDNYFNDQKDDVETSSENNSEEKEKVRESNKNVEGELKSEAPEKEKVVQYDGEDPNTAQGLSGAITHAAVSGANFVLRVNIDQYVTGGDCELTIKRNGATIYSNIVSIIGSASTATCEGFDIPVNRLGGGPVEININLSADGKGGVIRGEANI